MLTRSTFIAAAIAVFVFGASPASAQRGGGPSAPIAASDLDCTDCVESSEIEDGAVGSADVNSAEVQLRVGSCPAGSSIRAVAANGTPSCEADTDTLGALTFDCDDGDFARLAPDGTGVWECLSVNDLKLVLGLLPPPILVVAYINRDADPAYNAEIDELIAKITDDNNDGVVSEGDIITTARYPVNFAAESAEFTNPLSAPITWASVSAGADSVSVRSTDDSGDPDGWTFQFFDDAPVPGEVACLKDEYFEYGNRAQAVIRDLFETETGGCLPTGQQDRLQVDSGVPSGGPILGISLSQLPSGFDDDFINVVITK